MTKGPVQVGARTPEGGGRLLQGGRKDPSDKEGQQLRFASFIIRLKVGFVTYK